jgi:hypothetical protein
MSDQHDEVAARRALRQLQAQWQQVLDAESAALDDSVAARLEQVRTSALQAAPAANNRRPMLLASIAAVLLLALALPLAQTTLQRHDQATMSPAAEADFDLSELEPWQEDAELIDDLDFYAWLELEAEHAS